LPISRRLPGSTVGWLAGRADSLAGRADSLAAAAGSAPLPGGNVGEGLHGCLSTIALSGREIVAALDSAQLVAQPPDQAGPGGGIRIFGRSRSGGNEGLVLGRPGGSHCLG
jgi:hypothetical protein